MNDEHVFDLTQLGEHYNYTRICCPLSITCTSCDGDSSRHKSYFALDKCNISQNDVYLGSVPCCSASLIKHGERYLATIIVKKLFDLDQSIDLMDDYSKFFSYFLARDEYNPHNGVPLFAYDFMEIDVRYGTSIDNCAKKMFLTRGKVTSTSTSKPWTFEHALPSVPYSMDKQRMFLNAMAKNDVFAKFIHFYSFFDKISGLTEYHNLKKTLASSDLALLQVLSNAGISQIKPLIGEEKSITEDTIANIRRIRNRVYHAGKDDSDVHRVLYEYLLPIIKQIVESDYFEL